MTNPASPRPASELMKTLSRLLIPLRLDGSVPAATLAADASLGILGMSREEFDRLLDLAHSNHVDVRAMNTIAQVMRHVGDTERAVWAEEALATEQARIQHAVGYLHEICLVFQQAGLDITVMKSLDHWPDLGSDLDLYTNAQPKAVLQLMASRFQATTSERSWGDRLAHKWNFEIPGLPESVEFHIGRLGQTGEQMVLGSKLPVRSRTFPAGGFTFPVAHASDRLMISTLQRMYRHFYFRLCDVLDSAWLVKTGQVDFADLERSAKAAGIWEGVACYLKIVSDYIRQYGDPGLELPASVLSAARFGGEKIYFGKEFLRVPIRPQAIGLYRTQLVGLMSRGKLGNTARLSLLPWLASIAFLEQKRTGSDKGIW